MRDFNEVAHEGYRRHYTVNNTAERAKEGWQSPRVEIGLRRNRIVEPKSKLELHEGCDTG